MAEGESVGYRPIKDMDTDQMRAELDVLHPMPGTDPEGLAVYNDAMSALAMGKATLEQRAHVGRAEQLKEALARPYDMPGHSHS